MSTEIFTKAVELIVLILVAIITKEIIPMIKSKVNETQLDVLVGYVSIFVKAVEQVVGSGHGQEKKQQVVQLLTDKANELHINVTPDVINSLIEDAVKTMNDALVESN